MRTDQAVQAIRKALELTKEAKVYEGYVGLIGAFNMAEDALTQALTTLDHVSGCVHEVEGSKLEPRQLSFNFNC